MTFSMPEHHPQVFYKYASPGTTLRVLEGGKIRWSSPLTFNDVSEFQRMPRFEPTIADAHRLLPSAIMDIVFGFTCEESILGGPARLLVELNRRLVASGLSREILEAALAEASSNQNADARMEEELRKFMQEQDLGTARVLCVTIDHDNDSMWANYAGDHTGCVLGFRHIETLSTPLLAARRVSYTKDRPVIGSGLDFLLYGDTLELRRRTLDAICFTKKIGWSHENEWRAVTWRENERGHLHGDYPFFQEELESVTMGARISPETEATVRGLMQKYPSASLYAIEVTNGEPKRVLA